MSNIKILAKKYECAILAGVNVIQGIVFMLGIFSSGELIPAEPWWIFLMANFVIFGCNIALIMNIKNTGFVFSILIPFVVGLELGCQYMDMHLFYFFIY
jgi:hypothetical protein